PTARYGGATAPVALAAGSSATSLVVSDLACNTSYHFRFVATAGAATAGSADLTFMTLACTAPTIMTSSPLPAAAAGSPYTAALAAIDGAGPSRRSIGAD